VLLANEAGEDEGENEGEDGVEEVEGSQTTFVKTDWTEVSLDHVTTTGQTIGQSGQDNQY